MEDEYPECPICLDIFGNNPNHIKAPKILKCGDNICKECLEKTIKDTKEESFICPICKESIIKEENIENYVTNRLIIKMINDCFNSIYEEVGNKEEDQSTKYNIILLGDPDVGKTSIFNRLSKDKFSETYSTTVGCDMTTYYIKYKNKKYQLIFRDTSGQERFKAVTKNFLRNIDGVLFIFDITNKESFEGLKSWYDLFKEQNEKVVGLLIGNKCDNERKVDEEEAKKFARDYGLKKYFETSAKLDKKIKKAIAYLLEEIIKSKQVDNDLSFNEISIQAVKGKGKNKCEC